MVNKPLHAEISVNDASKMTANWRSFNSTATLNSYSMDQIMPNAYTISADDVKSLMAEPGVNGIRIYFGYLDEEPTPLEGDHFAMKLVMVGVDSNGNDIVFNGDHSGIYDQFQPCPDKCDTNNSPLT